MHDGQCENIELTLYMKLKKNNAIQAHLIYAKDYRVAFEGCYFSEI